MKARRSGCIWDLFWSSAGFTDGLDMGVGGLGSMVRKREEDGGRVGEEWVLGEEIRWFVWDLLNLRSLLDIQGGS